MRTQLFITGNRWPEAVFRLKPLFLMLVADGFNIVNRAPGQMILGTLGYLWCLCSPHFTRMLWNWLKSWCFPLNYEVSFSQSRAFLAPSPPLGFQLRLSHIPAVDFSSGSRRSAGWFHPADALFKKGERKTFPVVSVRCVSSRCGSAKMRVWKGTTDSVWGRKGTEWDWV